MESQLARRQIKIRGLALKLDRKINRAKYQWQCGCCSRVFITRPLDGAVFITKLENRLGYFLDGTYGSDFHYEQYSPRWKVVDSEVISRIERKDDLAGLINILDTASSIVFCGDCIVRMIGERKIILETSMQECFKCCKPFISYREFENRTMIVVNKYGRCFAKGNDCHYKIDGGDIELVKSKSKKFIDSWPEDQMKFYSNPNYKYYLYEVTWICRKCLYNAGFPLELCQWMNGVSYVLPDNKNQTISGYGASINHGLPMPLCLIIGDYLSPPYMEHNCKNCRRIYLDVDEKPINYLTKYGYFDYAKLVEKIKYENLVSKSGEPIVSGSEIKENRNIFMSCLSNVGDTYFHFSNFGDFICCQCILELIKSGAIPMRKT